MPEKSTIKTAYRKNPASLPFDAILNIYLGNGTITLNDIVNSGQEDIMKSIIDKVHPYKIKKYADGRYSTYVADETKPSGRRQIKKKSRAELQKYLLEFYGINSLESKSHTMTFGELFKEWVNYKKQFINAPNRKKGLSPTTIRRYEREYKKYFSETTLAKTTLDHISSIVLENAFMEIIQNNNIAEHCANNLLGYIMQAFRYARRAEYITKDPAESLDRQLLLSRCTFVPPKSDTERVLTVKEMAALRQATLNHEKLYPEYMPNYCIELAMLTGMRIGEIAALKWSCIDNDFIHIDFSEHRLDYSDRPSELVIGEPKNGKHREIPLNDDTRELFNRIRALNLHNEDGFIFVKSGGQRCPAHDVSCAVARRAEEAGIKKTSIHGIRRTVSSLLRAVLPISAVSNMLGHLEVTNELHYHYDTTEIDERRNALSKISSNVINFPVVSSQIKQAK